LRSCSKLRSPWPKSEWLEAIKTRRDLVKSDGATASNSFRSISFQSMNLPNVIAIVINPAHGLRAIYH
jgi:hypothetical protein